MNIYIYICRERVRLYEVFFCSDIKNKIVKAGSARRVSWWAYHEHSDGAWQFVRSRLTVAVRVTRARGHK
jgi:hypothetical protein